MNNHSLILRNRELLHASGVKSADSLGDEKIILHTEQGDLSVSGSGLTVEMLDTQSGELEVHGKIDAMKYLSEKRHIPDNFISRLFR